MSSLLARIARALAHRWGRGLVAVVLVIFGLGLLAANGETPPDSFNVPGTESQRALDLFSDHQPALAGADSTLVFSVEQGRIAAPENRVAIERTLAEIAGLDKVIEVGDPFASGDASISPDGRLASVDVRYEGEVFDVEKADGELLEETARGVESAGVTVEMRGIVADIAAEQSFPIGELIGVAIAIVLLTLLFRSGAAMGVTLAAALLGVMAGQMLIAALAEPLQLPSFAAVIAVMLGLGAGIDYSLLIVGRYREQRAAGNTPRDAAAKAAATAGSAVLAAGLIVVVAISGLLLVGIPAIGKMGVAAALAVATVVVSSLTVLPILGGAFAKRLRPKRPEHVARSEAFARWAERVTARPWATIAVGVALLLVFAIPMTDMRLGQPDDGNQPSSTTQRRAYDQLNEAFGPGSSGPLLVAVDLRRGDSRNAERLDALGAAIAADPGVDAPGGEPLPALTSEDGEMATIFVEPATSPQDERTTELVERLRGETIPAATHGSGLAVYVGGQTAGFQDFSAKVSERLPLFIAAVIGLSVLLLIAAFRSLWVPLVSACFNLLSIGAAYGVVVAVFQWGWGASLIGAESGVPIISFMPLMMFAILFGLSMDYNVFLLSRVHEAYNEGDGPRESVIHGLARIAKVVLFAGLIMAAVFLAFTSAPDTISKMFGVGLGAAILIDVTIVRLLIAPAVVTLLGDRAWWLPGWLERLLPNVSLEGHTVDAIDEPEIVPTPRPATEGAVD
jgi:putative drug exporter of the RND superfamily